ALEGEPHAVGSDAEASALHQRPLRRILEEHGVGVVDVAVDFLPYRQRGQPLETTSRPRNRQMIHLARRPVADSEPDHLVVGPERSIERGQTAPGEPLQQSGIEIATPRYEGTCASGRLVTHDQTDGMAGHVFPGESWRPGGNDEALDAETARPAVSVAER